MQHPTNIGKYDVEEFLGGGMSHVYKARDRVLGRTVAVKILTPEGCLDNDVRERFLLEARMAGNISHENIVSIYDFGEDDGKPFLVMEFLRGDTLRTLVKEHRIGTVDDALRMAQQLGRALEYIHGQNIVHRDIKPENVLVDSRGCVKLMDFGIAKVKGLNLTQAGFVIGTPYYMAPEQVKGEEITGAADIFAFGVLLFEMLTGEKPYSADSPARVFHCIVSEPPDQKPLDKAGVPGPVRVLILKCLEKEASNRPRGFGDVCGAIDQLLSVTTPTAILARPEQVAVPAVPLKKARSKWVLIGAGLGVAAVLGSGIAFYPRPKVVTLPPTNDAKVIGVPDGMVDVPAGEFLFGEKNRKVFLPEFYIDKTEVSNRQYTDYCEETGCKAPDGKEELPVVNITIEQARGYANWAAKRLPNEQEWEKAARGRRGNDFPWGNEADIHRTNINTLGTVSVDAFPSGESPLGVRQMAGNVFEFVNKYGKPDPRALKFFPTLKPPASLKEPWVMVRGGSYLSQSINEALSSQFGYVPARHYARDIGFRCVKDP